ncbi:sucrose-phosphate phosphatase [Pseudanabaena yagii]|nr:sucrose-phosphate phosphatase [Pseudanabaena yagii]
MPSSHLMSLAIFVTDLDNTLVGDKEALRELNHQLSDYRQNQGTKIVYATGRSLTLYHQLAIAENLLPPDALITAVGTEIYDHILNPDHDWATLISQGWNRDLVCEIASQFEDLIPQPESEQRPFKISYFLSQELADEIIPLLKTVLISQNATVIYSGGKDLDILPKDVDKGKAVSFLSKKWQIEPSQTLVCGDSGNDISLFAINQVKGIIVGNAHLELRDWHYQNPSSDRYFAKSNYAQGIMEGLKHFNW